jgi:hypothetical protein
MDNEFVYYTTYDLPNCNRLHKWVNNERTIYAIGNGPIKYITKDEFIEAMQLRDQQLINLRN